MGSAYEKQHYYVKSPVIDRAHIQNDPWYTVTLTTTARPEQNGGKFADNIFRCIFLNENGSIFTDVIIIKGCAYKYLWSASFSIKTLVVKIISYETLLTYMLQNLIDDSYH